MVTMSDVARVAQVSATTVSHVINQTRKVDPETEKAVRDAIELTGYFGDGIARSLRKGTTETIGLAMSAISNPYFGDVVHAIERRISGAGYTLLLVDTHDESERERRVVRDLMSHRVDAMILAPSDDSDSLLDALSKRGIPTVLIDRVPARTRAGMDATASSHLRRHGQEDRPASCRRRLQMKRCPCACLVFFPKTKVCARVTLPTCIPP